ncbi:MAG TPA: hypothetical protein PKC87_05995, partial [Candidatus Absconditabacterales bacterium]|nr:hypothetical protein [Candidatus Absconditabacterales bacterium]
PYSFDGTNRGTSNILNIASQRDVGSITITGYVRDGSGNITTKIASYTFYDELVNSDEFTGSNNVGTGPVNVNRKISSNANEGACGIVDITADSIYQQGEKGICTLSGDILTYTPHADQTGNDMCGIFVVDDEGTGFGNQVEIYRGGIDSTSQTNNSIPELGEGIVSSGNVVTTGIGTEYFYNGIINISSNVNDTIGINSGTCEYSINGTNRISADYTGTSSSGICYKNNLNPQSNIEIFFRVKNINGITGESSGNIYIYDDLGPSFEFNNNSGYECLAGTLSINLLEDLGIGFGSNTYSLDGLNWNSSNILNIEGQQPGIIIKTGYVRDLLGNQTTQTATYTFNNVGISANNFTGNSNVGNSTKTGNWKTLSNASEFWCGSGNVVYSGINTQGSKGTCSVSGDTIFYTPGINKIGNDSCVIRMIDNENSLGVVTAYRGGIDTLAPNAVSCTDSQSFDTSINVSCSATEGTIKYTSDGSIPSCNGNIRSNQII